MHECIVHEGSFPFCAMLLLGKSLMLFTVTTHGYYFMPTELFLCDLAGTFSFMFLTNIIGPWHLFST